MTLIFSTDRSIYKHLNRSLVKIHKNLWAGNLTIREIERMNALISTGNHLKTKIFKTSGKEINNYINNSIDFLFLL